MIKTILTDDEPRGLNSLKKMLEQHCPEVKVIAECTSADSAIEKIHLLEPQLLFLDISMPGKTGFDLLNELETAGFEIIFVTAHNEYLIKPIDEDLLVEAVKRAEKKINTRQTTQNIETFLYNIQKLQTPHEMKLCIPSLKGFQVVDLADVIFCEAQASYTNFHLTNGKQLVASKAISEYEILLHNTSFYRIHKSYLVNLNHIKEYQRGEGGTVLLSNNMEVEVSRRKKEFFIAKMKEMYRY
jgi:two-component system, LytTR family, response regulator